MTPTEQRIALAQACGWTRMSMYSHIASGKQLLGLNDSLYGTPPCDKNKPEDDQSFEPVPEYDSDLNAMHEAEKMFPHPASYYFFTLAEVCGGEHQAYRATAPQRLEAILRVLNLWDESKRHPPKTNSNITAALAIANEENPVRATALADIGAITIP